MKWKRMRWAEHVAIMGEGRGVYRVLVWENLRERKHWDDPGLRWEDNKMSDLQEWVLGVWTGLIWLRIETGGRHL
jgi:hypothetical protein